MFQSPYHARSISDGFNHRAAPEAILRPVNTLFVLLTLIIALMLNLLPWGNWMWVPDWVMLVLLFWVIREPHLINFGVAFFVGLLMDTHNGSVLGEHAFSYVLLAFSGVILSKRLPSFSPKHQTLHVFPLFFITHGVRLLVHTGFNHGSAVTWEEALLCPALTALLWPMMLWLLLLPQRRAIDVDLNRPL
jgi:rod shape-determining protein MreD